ncbi:MAG: NAD(P)/FAD-dependent oxidoreductase [Lentisphaeria bacterium]
MIQQATEPQVLPVLIIGAGPVGLLLANLLGKSGIPVVVAEQRRSAPEWSRAIGITPPSLNIFKSLGLHETLETRGVCVDEAVVHDDRGPAGQVSFAHLDSEFRHILALPQCETMQILTDNLARFPSVCIRRGVKLTGLKYAAQYAVAELLDSGDPDNPVKLKARWIIGCDGADSSVRHLAEINFTHRHYGPRFVMSDYDDQTDLGRGAHLYFKRDGSVESFPLPDKRRRWVVLANHMTDSSDNAAFLEDQVAGRAGQTLVSSTRRTPVFEFTPESVAVDRMARERVILAGDAAHVMSPIGGQGMNTGFADAELVATILPRLLDGETAEPLLAAYDRCRQRAARAARRRAAFGMWVGTRTGRISSGLRNLAVRGVMASPLARLIPPHFAMLTIPYNSADKTEIPRQ